MHISEISMDLFLLENHPERFVSLYESTNLNEGTIGDIRRVISDVIKNIGSSLSMFGIQTKDVIKEINKEISNSKNIILGHLKEGNSFSASEELNALIYKIKSNVQAYYKSRGVLGKVVLTTLFAFIIIMTILLLMFTLMNHAIIFILLIVIIPIIITMAKLTMNFLKFRHKSKTGFPEDELNLTILKATGKIGIDNKIMSNFLSNTTKKITEKMEKDFDRVIESKSSSGSFTSRAIVMIIKTVKDQSKSGYF